MRRVLPPVPRTLSEAFALGELAQRITTEAAWSSQRAELLAHAAKLVGSESMTLEQLEQVPRYLLELEEHRGIISRVTGAFTFINLMWLVSIVGIGV